ncbi:MAG TPA: erythromycin esterase family protein [Sedimentisphaerales bacterium]|nr:erythromycin esterase family protein [Sedimentisphaerales bacterium]
MSLQKDFVPIFLAVGLLFFTVSSAEETPRKDDFRIAWLKQHAIPLRSIDPNDEDFSDLEPLLKVLRDVRIVQLGEQSHGDGATFHAKTRLIKFLHQELGFDVLAFESGLYTCRKAWELLQGGMEPHKAFSHGVLGIWSGSEQVRLLIDYWGRVAKSQQPLELCGFDCQLSDWAFHDLLVEDVNALWDKLGPAAPAAGQRDAIAETLSKLDHWYDPGPQERQQWHQAMAAWCKSLETARPSDALPQAELEFWRRVAAGCTWLTAIWGLRSHAPDDFRPQQMASNLVWLARTVYPKRKIIVWAASSHLLRNPPPEWGVKMGHEVWKVLGTQTYAVGFTAAEGEYKGWFWDKAGQLEPPAPGSLEDLFVRAGFDNAFLDFRHLGPDGAWLEEKLVARPFGYANDEANWSDMLDGIVFTKKMFPSTKRKED